MDKERIPDIYNRGSGVRFYGDEIPAKGAIPVKLGLFRFFTRNILLFLLLFFYQDVKTPFEDFFPENTNSQSPGLLYPPY